MDLSILKNKYDIIGNSDELNRALSIAITIAPADSLSVLVCGESGVGKDIIPKIIHQNSPRKNAKFFAVNCGAIAEGTIDSELFGHEKGAFTGAIEQRKGYFEEADGGTLFLDEIGELPLASQAKLLRVIQSGEFIRVGSSKVLRTNVRVIAATNKNLVYAISQGRFRSDLYYRLNAIQINLPSLRERKEDIQLLFRKFSSDFTEKYSRTRLRLRPDAVELLSKYRWPGNIRQLKSFAEAVSMFEGSKVAPGNDVVDIDARILSEYMPKDEGVGLPVPVSSQDSSPLSSEDKENIGKAIYSLKKMVDDLREEVDHLKKSFCAFSEHYGQSGQTMETPVQIPEHNDAGMVNSVIEVDEQSGDNTDRQEDAALKTLDDIKSERIRKVLNETSTKKEAARILGMSERTLYRWINEHKN